MEKLVIQCSDCGSYNEVKIGLFAKKTVKCTCGKDINVKDRFLENKKCPHCGNSVVFDIRKGENAVCPVCKQKINLIEDKYLLAEVKCPHCSSMQSVNKKGETHTCAVCGENFNIQRLIAQIEQKKSGLASIIKWDGDESLIVYKSPIENFNLGSQLIVRVGQEALFFRDGKTIGVFGAGRYTLEKNTLPALEEIYKLPDDSDIAIQTEVYFVNKTVLTGIKWGTPNKVRILESTLGFPVELGARGSFNLTVENSLNLLTNLIGTARSFVSKCADGGEGYGTEYIRRKFSEMITMNVTTMLANVITKNKINLLEVDTYKSDIARILGNAINEGVSDFGLRIPDGQFYITDIVTPDDDPNYIRMKEQYSYSIDIKDAMIDKRKIEAFGEVAMTQKKIEAELDMFDAQHASALAKVSTQGMSDAIVIEAKGNAEKTKLEGGAVVDLYEKTLKAEADALKAKGGDYKLESERMTDLEFAKSDFTILNVNIEGNDKWTCNNCGKTEITSRFCPDCGAKKLSVASSWDCRKCGKKGLTTTFCPDCGAKR